jgi:hypothetical protein
MAELTMFRGMEFSGWVVNLSDVFEEIYFTVFGFILHWVRFDMWGCGVAAPV